MLASLTYIRYVYVDVEGHPDDFETLRLGLSVAAVLVFNMLSLLGSAERFARVGPSRRQEQNVPLLSPLSLLSLLLLLILLMLLLSLLLLLLLPLLLPLLLVRTVEKHAKKCRKLSKRNRTKKQEVK